MLECVIQFNDIIVNKGHNKIIKMEYLESEFDK